jgi:Sec-independent protein translocase protein TatA
LAWLALVGVVAAVVLGAAALSWLYRALYTWSGYPAP